MVTRGKRNPPRRRRDPPVALPRAGCAAANGFAGPLIDHKVMWEGPHSGSWHDEIIDPLHGPPGQPPCDCSSHSKSHNYERKVVFALANEPADLEQLEPEKPDLSHVLGPNLPPSDCMDIFIRCSRHTGPLPDRFRSGLMQTSTWC